MPDPKPSPARVLIVDRSETFLAGAGGWLRDREDLVLVGTARTGTDALLAVDRLEPDVVVIDGVLPELGGLQVVGAIKGRMRAPFVVVTTFLATSAAREAAFAAGADGFLPKDDFVGAFELLLTDLLDRPSADEATVTRRERPTRPGPRNEPTP